MVQNLNLRFVKFSANSFYAKTSAAKRSVAQIARRASLLFPPRRKLVNERCAYL